MSIPLRTILSISLAQHSSNNSNVFRRGTTHASNSVKQELSPSAAVQSPADNNVRADASPSRSLPQTRRASTNDRVDVKSAEPEAQAQHRGPQPAAAVGEGRDNDRDRHSGEDEGSEDDEEEVERRRGKKERKERRRLKKVSGRGCEAAAVIGCHRCSCNKYVRCAGSHQMLFSNRMSRCQWARVDPRLFHPGMCVTLRYVTVCKQRSST